MSGFPDSFRTVKQSHTDQSCTACLAAMITGTSLLDVYTFLNREGGAPMWDDELALYLILHGLWLGHLFSLGARPVAGHQVKMEMNIPWSFAGNPASLTVKSKNHVGCTHAIFWDGRYVRDPDPREPDEKETLDGYDVFDIWPVVRIDYGAGRPRVARLIRDRAIRREGYDPRWAEKLVAK